MRAEDEEQEKSPLYQKKGAFLSVSSILRFPSRPRDCGTPPSSPRGAFRVFPAIVILDSPKSRDSARIFLKLAI